MLELAHLPLALQSARLAATLLALAQPPPHAPRQRTFARRRHVRQPRHRRHGPRVVPAVVAQCEARCALMPLSR